MLGPYRDPAPACADVLPDSCVPEGDPTRCCPGLSAPTPAGVAPRRAGPSVHVRALTAAATLLLLVSSASISAITWTVTSTILAERAQRSAIEPPPFGLVVQAMAASGWRAQHAPQPPSLDGLGTDTHDVDALWSRAQWRAASGSAITLARASVDPGALADGMGAARIVADPRGGLGVVDLDQGSAAAIVGLRRGDLVTAVNGFALRRPDDARRAWAAVAAGARHGRGAAARGAARGAPHGLGRLKSFPGSSGGQLFRWGSSRGPPLERD